MYGAATEAACVAIPSTSISSVIFHIRFVVFRPRASRLVRWCRRPERIPCLTYTTNVTGESLPHVFGLIPLVLSEKGHPTELGEVRPPAGRAVRVAAAGIFGQRDNFCSIFLLVHHSPGC